MPVDEIEMVAASGGRARYVNLPGFVASPWWVAATRTEDAGHWKSDTYWSRGPDLKKEREQQFLDGAKLRGLVCGVDRFGQRVAHGRLEIEGGFHIRRSLHDALPRPARC